LTGCVFYSHQMIPLEQQASTIKNKNVSNTSVLFIIKVVTCFDPMGSSSGLHCEPACLKNCIQSWDRKQCLQI